MERAGRSGRREDGVQDYVREKQLKKKKYSMDLFSSIF